MSARTLSSFRPPSRPAPRGPRATRAARGLASVGVVLSLFATAPVVRAGDDPAVQQGGALFKEGLRLFAAGDFEHAREKFSKAHALLPKSSAILWNLALAEANSPHAAVDALTHFRAYQHDPNARPKDLSEAETKWIPLLEPQVGELQIDGASGAAVKIDGGDAGSLPFASSVAVAPGPHHVESSAGGDSLARDVSVAAGQTVVVHLTAAPAAPPPPAPAAAAAPPPPAAPVPSRIDAASPPPASDAAGSSHSEASPVRLWLTVGLGVASVASLATGIYFGAQSNNDANAAQQIRSGLLPGGCSSPSATCTALTNEINGENVDHTASIGLYVGAGALAAGALASWLFLPKTVEARSVALPYFAPGAVGAAWATRF
jgi:hypothetical protein